MEQLTPVRLVGERVIVRLATHDDVGAILAYFDANREFLKPFEPSRPSSFYTETFWRSRVAGDQHDYAEGRAMRCFLFDRTDDRTVLGMVNVNSIIRGVAHHCTLGYGLGQHSEGRGLMREALELVIAQAFGPLNLHRIQANYMPHNRRSGGLLKRLGFQVEGYARDYLMLNGQWEDHVLTSLTNQEWRQI